LLSSGNPGIGKSRSLNWFLKLLMKNGKKFIYEARKDNIVYAFLPNKESYDTWEVSYSDFKINRCSILQNRNNYYIIDPSMPPKPPYCVSAKTILCAPPNKEHYRSWIKDDVEEKKMVKILFKKSGFGKKKN
jgi:hypothetical protein